MTPIRQLLSRIRWDQGFGRGEFALGYLDRLTQQIVVVSLREVQFPQGERQVFLVVDMEGQSHRIPFHRVRQVWRDNRLIWQRPQRVSVVPETKPPRVRKPGRSRRLRPRSAA